MVPAARAEVTLVLADGEPRRDDVDGHVRDGRAHLVVAATAYGFTIGPFVLPGATACLRCVDAHLGQHDPRRAVVLEQVGGLPDGPRGPGADRAGRRLGGARPAQLRRGRAAVDLVRDGRDRPGPGAAAPLVDPAPALRLLVGARPGRRA